VLWSLDLPLDALDEVAEQPVPPDEAAKAAELVERRIATAPAAYLTGEAWLQGVPFTVDPRVIVPRSLIAECLADATIDPWLSEQTTPCWTCAPATAAWPCWPPWPGPRCR
jgi:ribosomal protein L3 glutamine methyltransferase